MCALMKTLSLKSSTLFSDFGFAFPTLSLIGFDFISFPSTLPKEFNLHKFINYDEQFDKSFLEPLRFIVNAIGWNFEKQATLDGFF